MVVTARVAAERAKCESARPVCTLGIRYLSLVVLLYFVIALQVWKENFSLFLCECVCVCVSFFPLVRASACYHTNITFFYGKESEKYTTKMCVHSTHTHSHTFFSFALCSVVKFSLKWNEKRDDSRQTAKSMNKSNRMWECELVCACVRSTLTLLPLLNIHTKC